MKTDKTNAERQARWRERRKQEIVVLQASKGIPGLPVLSTIPGERRWASLLDQARASLRLMCDEMQAYYGDRSEQWQEGERAAAMQERIDAIEGILADLEMLAE